MKTCFFTLLQDKYSNCIEYDLFEKSFKYFHPDITLITFRDDVIDKLISDNPGVDMFNIKAFAAKLLYDEYELVVNIDADHIILSRLDEILEGDYDVAAPSNYNYLQNIDIQIKSYGDAVYSIVPEEQYIQAGLIASTSKYFWDTYGNASIQHAPYMPYKDNDVLNLVIQFGNYKFKLLDGGWTPLDPHRKSFYGCSSLTLEHHCQLVGGVPAIGGLPLKCYHVARGGTKPKFDELFNSEIVNWLYEKIQ